MGYAFFDIDLRNEKIYLKEADTILIDMFLRLRKGDFSFGEMVERQEIIRGVLLAHLNQLKPHGFAVEDFYLGGSANAYRSLAECMLTAKTTVKDFNSNINFIIQTASKIKKRVGVSGKSGDKTLVTKAIQVLLKKDMEVEDDIDLASADEHTNDAIIIGYGAARDILDSVKVDVVKLGES